MSHVGMVLASLAAAVALLVPGVRVRAWAMLAALILTPVLLLVDLRDAPQLDPLLDRPELAAGVGAVAAIALALLAVLFARRPGVFAALAVAAVPFRIPIEAGGSTANLLVPLYAVVGAGALAWLVPRLRARGARGDWQWVTADADPGAPGGEDRAPGWLERLLAGAVVLYAVQAAYSDDASKALEQVVFFYVPFLLLFVLLRELDWTPRLVGRCFTVVVALALVFVAIGFVEYQQRTLLLNPKVIASNQFESYFRVNSLFFDPNVYGRFLALVMLGIAAVLLWGRARRTVLLAAAALAVLWAGLVLTLSQSSFAALLAGLVVLAALRWSPWRSLAVAAVVAAVGAGAVLAFPDTVRLDLSSRESIDKATSGRFDLMDGGIALAAERPTVGQGSASFSKEYRRRERTSSERAVSASHTIPITVAAEQGAIGLAVYLALLAAALVRLLRGARGDVARAAIGAAFVALVVHTWLYAAFLEDPLSWTLLGVGAALARPGPTE
jgi:O-antigen ligase